MFRLRLDQRGRIDGERVILDGLAKDERESVTVAVPGRRRPSAFVTPLQEPSLNVLARNSLRRQVVELLADDLELDLELMVVLRSVTLF